MAVDGTTYSGALMSETDHATREISRVAFTGGPAARPGSAVPGTGPGMSVVWRMRWRFASREAARVPVDGGIPGPDGIDEAISVFDLNEGGGRSTRRELAF